MKLRVDNVCKELKVNAPCTGSTQQMSCVTSSSIILSDSSPGLYVGLFLTQIYYKSMKVQNSFLIMDNCVFSLKEFNCPD